MGERQLGLFLRAPPSAVPDRDADEELSARLSPRLLLGPSTWTFPGWEGIVYPRGLSREDLIERGLSFASRHPLFRTVGIDRSHYAPLEEDELRRYASELEPGYPCVIKAWNVLGALEDRQGRENPNFFDARLCEERVILPLARAFAGHVGALVFQLAPINERSLPHPEAFAARLDGFLGALPTAFRYAVELRNRELFTGAYLEVLARHRAAHVLNLWTHMPPLGKQLAVPGVLSAPFVVCRLSIPPGERYEEQKARFAPFDRIVQPDERMRADVVALAKACLQAKKTLYLTVNNKAEGSSPLTIRALIERLAGLA
ncbi:MAG: DUF72 domain-containing protein [Byssovorax sp.]